MRSLSWAGIEYQPTFGRATVAVSKLTQASGRIRSGATAWPDRHIGLQFRFSGFGGPATCGAP
ncbi:hypothetical protein GCM10009608_28120 [Pseudonocardia alaniniphila]